MLCRKLLKNVDDNAFDWKAWAFDREAEPPLSSSRVQGQNEFLISLLAGFL
jgi:hypothetical protein